MKFTKEFLLNVLEDYNDEADKISCKIIGHRRWSIDNLLIFKYQEKYYQVAYSYGSTECQDESPFEYADNEIECTEVRPVQKTITVYEAVE